MSHNPSVRTPPPLPSSAAHRLLARLNLVATPVAALAGAPNADPATPGPGQAQALMADMGMGALLHFKSLMALEGQRVHVARMCYDRQYAFERIAHAHASARDPLRRLALELFQAYHRRELQRPEAG